MAHITGRGIATAWLAMLLTMGSSQAALAQDALEWEPALFHFRANQLPLKELLNQVFSLNRKHIIHEEYSKGVEQKLVTGDFDMSTGDSFDQIVTEQKLRIQYNPDTKSIQVALMGENPVQVVITPDEFTPEHARMKDFWPLLSRVDRISTTLAPDTITVKQKDKSVTLTRTTNGRSIKIAGNEKLKPEVLAMLREIDQAAKAAAGFTVIANTKKDCAERK